MLEQSHLIPSDPCEQSSFSKTPENPQQRIQRIKRTKNIRKDKVLSKKMMEQDAQESQKSRQGKLTREQKLLIQKEKNRIAAQESRDKQKKYVKDLEDRISELQQQASSQLCFRCRASLSDTTHSEGGSEGGSQQELHDRNEKQQSFYDDHSFYFRDSQSRISVSSIGKFLFVVMIVVAIGSFSNSIEKQAGFSGRLLQAIAPKSNQAVQQVEKQGQVGLISQNHLIQLEVQKFSGMSQECTYEYFQHYLKDKSSAPQSSKFSYENRLLNCKRPQLIMKKNKQGQGSFFEGLFTIILDNPQIIEVVPQQKQIYLDNAISLNGLYELEVKFMNLKKIIGQQCLR